jgi:hypothetical protein
MPLIGADPEFFVRHNKTFVSGHIFGCGTKELPMKTKHGFVQVDGLALEANVPPSKTKAEFISGVLGVIGDLNSIVRKKNCTIIAQPTAEFTAEYMDKLPDEVKQLGCNPDYNAYSGGMNDVPDGSVTFRTGAGHIHIGWTKDQEPTDFEHFENCCALARQMDYFVGLRTLKFDNDARRRELYGKAGAFRPKPYGMEYRVPSNAWCKSKILMGIVYDATVNAFENTNGGNDLDTKFAGFAQHCIDKNVTDWDFLNPEVAKEINFEAA